MWQKNQWCNDKSSSTKIIYDKWNLIGNHSLFYHFLPFLYQKFFTAITGINYSSVQLFYYHHSVQSVHPTSSIPSFLLGWLKLLPNFQKWGLGRTSTLRGALLEKRGVTFSGGGGGCNFYKKNKLKSEIFNDKNRKIYL